jgi:hypothetical protein
MTDDGRATMRDVSHRPPTGEPLTRLWQRGPDGREGDDGAAGGEWRRDAASDD